MRKFFLVAATALLAGCGPSPVGFSRSTYSGMLAAREQPNASFSYNHFLSIAMGRDYIRPRFERAEAQCLHDSKFQCTLISASLDAADANDYGPSATLLISLPHAQIAQFQSALLKPVAGDGGAKVQSQTTSAENVSQEAADATRKVKQLSDYRDRLAALAKRPGLSVDDLIKVESELSKAQGDLDDATSQLNNVADRVAKERLSVSFDVATDTSDAFRPVGRTWRSAVDLFGQSTANALQFSIQVIPWLPIILAAFFLFRWLWRIARRRSADAKSD